MAKRGANAMTDTEKKKIFVIPKLIQTSPKKCVAIINSIETGYLVMPVVSLFGGPPERYASFSCEFAAVAGYGETTAAAVADLEKNVKDVDDVYDEDEYDIMTPFKLALDEWKENNQPNGEQS